MFVVPGGRDEHHTRAPCALAPTFQLSRRLSLVPAGATLRQLQSRLLFKGEFHLLKRRCDVWVFPF